MAKITGTNKALCDALARIGIDTINTRRVVIDIPAGSPPIIYTESFVDESIVDVVLATDGIRVSVSTKKEE